jgi:transcriptional regulator with PAS, ATPase and Fis domain
VPLDSLLTGRRYPAATTVVSPGHRRILVVTLATLLKDAMPGGTFMLVGNSIVMQNLRHQVTRIARTPFTVLVEGESGVGKELVAREVHLRSARLHGPFIAVNCAALVETLVETELFGIEERTATGVRGRRGKFELANGGTLFLDEVGDLSPTAQAKLLRVLQDMTVERVGGHDSRVVDTRIVAATNRHLGEMVRAGRFRADLYYRLAGVEVEVPPLRDRRDDIPLLMTHFLRLYARAAPLTVSAPAIEALLAYDWPGNVRQLGRVIERAVALSTTSEIVLGDLPDAIARRPLIPRIDDVPIDGTLRSWSSRYARAVLAQCEGNKKRACDILDVSYHTLKSLIEHVPDDETTRRRVAALAAEEVQNSVA